MMHVCGRVTRDDWCVSYTSGGKIPSGMVEYSPYRFEGDKLIKGERYGEVMTKEEAEEHALKKGYLQHYCETEYCKNKCR